MGVREGWPVGLLGGFSARLVYFMASMAIPPPQIQLAEDEQDAAAQDQGAATRLIAGPGTGKSRSIEKRVLHLLNQRIQTERIFVISFTRATAQDLTRRIRESCSRNGYAIQAASVSVSTMHSLALRALRRADLLTMFPVEPRIFDQWEQENIFDPEFAVTAQVTGGRAAEIRLAYDAFWQTLQDAQLAPVTTTERQRFETFYPSTTTLYSCLLPGEVVRRCVAQMRVNVLEPVSLLHIEHLLVDEFQDLNQCDQEFVRRIADAGAILWVAGDDDQSIYSFRHAAPAGIRQFDTTYPGSATHFLTHCFRCTPGVLDNAAALAALNPGRLPKTLQSLYLHAAPPVQGRAQVWRLNSGGVEASSIGRSCRDLIDAGLPADEIVILICNRRVQLPLIRQELDRLAVGYEAPQGMELADTIGGRLILSLLRIVANQDDYLAHRALLGLHNGVGLTTCRSIATAVGINNLNFRDIFYAPQPQGVFDGRAIAAIGRCGALCQQLTTWSVGDTLAMRAQDIETVIGDVLDPARAITQQAIADWQSLISQLPPGMTLDELIAYLSSEHESAQIKIIQDVHERLGSAPGDVPVDVPRVRILTMHGAKGLSGTVVFIPGLEQELFPNRRALRSPGLLEEQRRLLYVSMTRARVRCVLTLARRRSGQQSFALVNQPATALPPSQFITELNVPVENRNEGLRAAEITDVLADRSNL